MQQSLFVTALAVVVASAAGCSDTAAAPSGPDASHDTGISPPPSDGAPGDDAAKDGGGVATSTFRVAHLSPDLGPVDFCYRAAPAEWVGPVLGSSPDAGPPTAQDGGVTASLAFASVTSYVTVPGSGTFDVALVAAGDLSCGHPRAIGSVTLDAGKRATIALMGLDRADAGTASAMTITAFTDDTTTTPTMARTRFVHAALGDAKSVPEGALSATAMAASGAIPLAAEIPPGRTPTPTSTAPTIDPLGYHSGAPLVAQAALRFDRLAGDGGAPSFLTPTADLRLASGSVHTGFVLNDGVGGYEVLWCDDASSGSLVTECTLFNAQ